MSRHGISTDLLLTTIQAEKLDRNYDLLRAEHSSRGHYDDAGVWQGGLLSFVRYFWHVLEPATEFVDGWTLAAMCQHLEAVTFGEITRLLINVPPGFMKSLLTDVFWPAWEWGAMGMPHLRYVTFSYSARLTQRDNDRFAALITSPEYRALYGDVVQVANTGIQKVTNLNTGWKVSTSIGGVGTGERGDRVILDDPHNVKEAESELIRTTTVQWFREAMSNRLNNPKTGAIIIIMQRVHEADVSGVILDLGLDYVHLMIKMQFDPRYWLDDKGGAKQTAIGWSDPRLDLDDLDGCTDVLAWPERFDTDDCARIKAEVGPYAFAAQYQQAPAPRGGGIFKTDWWQVWDPPNGRFPEFEYLIGSLDSAFTEKESNDPSGFTVWGVFRNEQGKRRIMLVHAWRKHLQFAGNVVPLKNGEHPEIYRRRAQPHWGLIEWVADSCRRFKVDKVLIEAKASGISASQELRRRHGREGWGIQLCNVKGDKWARAIAVQATFSQLQVYAPIRDWSEMVIEEMAVFPKGKYKDLTDSATQAITHLRDIGMAQSDEEAIAETQERVMHRPRPKAIYPV